MLVNPQVVRIEAQLEQAFLPPRSGSPASNQRLDPRSQGHLGEDVVELCRAGAMIPVNLYSLPNGQGASPAGNSARRSVRQTGSWAWAMPSKCRWETRSGPPGNRPLTSPCPTPSINPASAPNAVLATRQDGIPEVGSGSIEYFEMTKQLTALLHLAGPFGALLAPNGGSGRNHPGLT